ncbi:hypothetical protein KTR60_10035 [Rhodococcus sp. C1]|uniref:hypothetical protein n=1 Tax=Rhodococcus sp. C1 TaxID=644410 RepID=UPI001E52D45B|nr:hypothetical protein [Rhodococcus sp. C1]UEL35040.1 hypothetical protein KTR60_10035 [Rhodococcus sp. C1]
MTLWRTSWTRLWNTSSRTIGIVALILGLVSIGLSLAAVGRLEDWEIQLGPLGTWVGGLGTAAAASMAYVTLRQLLRTRTEQQAEQQDRVADERARVTRRTGAVQVRTIPGETAGGVSGWSVTLTNRSGHPIHDVRWIGLVAMRPDPPEILTEFICMPTNSEFADYAPFVPDSESRGVEYLAIPPTIRESHYPFPRIEFTDDDGYLFQHVLDRASPHLELRGRWELKGTAPARKAKPMRIGKVIPPPEIHPATE